MPGIVGLIARQPAPEGASTARTMVACLRHECFHRTGTVVEEELNVYAGWIAHEDCLATGQPYQNESKEITLILSGECYPDAAEKCRLRLNGHAFTDQGNDWLVHAYEEQGDKFFENLNGLFSGLIIDRRRRRIILFTDRYGMGRIYWHETSEAFYFASEAKALLRVLPALRAFDREGVAQFLGVGCPLGERTLFRDLHRLPGAARWTFVDGIIKRETYFSAREWENLPTLPAAEYESRFRSVWAKILPRYYESEAKVGLSLTGGLDTRLIMACHRHDPRRETSYTFTGPMGHTLDDRLAARVAAACGLEHQLLRLKSDFFGDFASHADKTVFVTDGCSGILGAHEIYFHRQARALATVRLTGNYGSEICRAISTFKALGLAPRLLSPDLLPMVADANAQLAAAKKHPVTFAAFQEIPLNLFGNLAAGQSLIRFRTPYLDNELVALCYQCPPVLKKSPLPTMRLVKSCSPALARIPTDRGHISDRRDPEIFLRRAIAEVTFKLDYCSNAGLPRPLGLLDPLFKPIARGLGIAGRHKFLMYSTWFRNDLAAYLRDRIAAASASGFWNPSELEAMARRHLTGEKDYPSEINAELTLESAERQLLTTLPRGLDN